MRALELILVEILVATSALRAEDTAKNYEANDRCKLPLGMEEGKIPDDAITASSSYESKSVGPQNARIRQEKNGGAWCPKAQISSDVREYLEVDLTRDHLVTWTETQGRFGNGQGQEYAESFFLEYWRDSRWHPYKSLGGDRILRGNSNTYLVEQQKLDLPFVASRVRFVPYSQHPRTVCMRVEIFGCVWDQGTRRYEAPRGRVFGPGGANAEDLSYDGLEEDDGRLTGGLGQLTDGVIGEDPTRIESSSSSNWVGWCDLDPVVLVFEFEQLREFAECVVHVANAPDKGVETFSRARVRFSGDGKRYEDGEDKIAEFGGSTRAGVAVLSIDLDSRNARYVRLELVPRSKWLLVSEVTFRSVIAAFNVTEEFPENPDTIFLENRTMVSTETPVYNETLRETNQGPDAFPIDESRTYVGLVSGALALLALLLICAVLLVKLRGRNKVALVQKHTALLCGSPSNGLILDSVKDGKLSNRRVAVSQSLRVAKLSEDGASGETGSLGYSRTPDTSGKRCGLYEKTCKLFSEENLAYERHSCRAMGKDTDEKFRNEAPARRENFTIGTKHEGYYAATDILTIKRREQQPGTSLFTSLRIDECPGISDAPNSYAIQRISRHRLRILDKIGEGSFGFVHLCEAKGIQIPGTGDTNCASRNRRLVAVRSLWRGVTDSFKKAFMRDMCALAEIRDANIARVVALVEEEPFGAVFEYGELGDLPNYLRGEYPERSDETPIGSRRLLNFVAQIASGMKYLESIDLAHCDLAARNCTVSKNHSIKISDHAVYRDKYDGEYYVNERYAKIPLRWMAWEAVLLGKRNSCSADVWSYAITVWEILNRCESLPLSDMTSEQVLENCGRWYHGTTREAKNKPRLPDQPDSCPRELYRLMNECWNKRPEDRPSFAVIHNFLIGFELD